MRHYKLSAWPELPAAYRRTAYRRLLHEMSQRYVSLGQLSQASGLPRAAVIEFLADLRRRELLIERGEDEPAPSLLGALQALIHRRRQGAAVVDSII